MNMAPKLYSNKDSGNCYKIRLLAALLDIPLEHVEMDFFNDQHHSPSFLAINPRGELPALVDGNKVFADSASIMVYLAGTYPDRGSTKGPSSFWSYDVAEQAAIVDWLAFSASWIQFGVCRARAMVSFNWPINASEEMVSDAKVRGDKSLQILEQRLEKEDWLALGRPTIADVSIFVYAALAPMGDVSLDHYPAVRAWIKRMRSLPGFIPIEGLDDPMYRRRQG